MARAKRTERAEARRRYRAAAADRSEERSTTRAQAASAARHTTGLRRIASAAAATHEDGFGQRSGPSIRPVNVREDLASLPWIAVHTKALWLPLLITVASTVLHRRDGRRRLVAGFMFAYFIQTPAIGGVFLAGFLAPRASWLLGAIVGLWRRSAIRSWWWPTRR